MSNMIGKISKKDWSLAPADATHITKIGNFYKCEGEMWYVYDIGGEHWGKSANNYLWLKDNLILKEEDLEMTKVVGGIEDFEIGMFLKDASGNIVVVSRSCGSIADKLFYTCVDMGETGVARNAAGGQYYDRFTHWSYTYDGEYTPIVKETEAERKIKELEETVKSATQTLELAQKQLQEYKEMK